LIEICPPRRSARPSTSSDEGISLSERPRNVNRPTATVQRRLAAIFCADVAGYTRLMNADEVGTLRLLTSHRAITDRLIQQHGGRIANTAGDSILAEFPSAVDALQCALGIQERITAVQEEVPEERRVSFRIGLHVGEAMVRNGDMFGDGVNVAARLQGLAEPGSVCLSGSAHEYTYRVLPVAFEDLGGQSVKSLDTPIRAYLARPSKDRHSRDLPLVHRVHEIYLVRRLYGILLKALATVVQPEGLVSIEAPVLAAIADSPGINQRQLAERVAIDLKRAREIVKHLEQLGLIEKIAATGQRSYGLRLTSSGLKVRERLRPAVIAVEDRIMAPLSDTEREIFKDLAARVIKANEAAIADHEDTT
jgi:adenylate cyclase